MNCDMDEVCTQLCCVHAGINTAIYSPSGANSGVGFAIPVDIIRSSVDQIIKFGRVIRPILGISFAPDQSSEQVRLDLHIRGQCLTKSTASVSVLHALAAGCSCTADLHTCPLSQLDAQGIICLTLHLGMHSYLTSCHSCLNSCLVSQLGVQGILVLDARNGGPAWKSGIKGTSRDKYGRLVLGDIITAMNGKKVRTASDLYKLLDKCDIGDQIDMEVSWLLPC